MKKVVAGAAVVFTTLLLLAGCGTTSTKSSSNSSSNSTSSSAKKSKLATAKMDVEATFTNSSETKLVDGVTTKDIASLKDEVDALPTSEAKAKLAKEVAKASGLLVDQLKASSKKEERKGEGFKFEEGDTAYVTHRKVYTTNVLDSSWTRSTFKVAQVSVMTTTPFKYDGNSTAITAHGVIAVGYSYTAGNTDLDPMLGQATISTDSGTQADVNSFDSDTPEGIDSGVTKKGILYFPVETLNKVSDVHSIRLKFTCYPQDESSDDSKDYDLTIPLNN